MPEGPPPLAPAGTQVVPAGAPAVTVQVSGVDPEPSVIVQLAGPELQLTCESVPLPGVDPAPVRLIAPRLPFNELTLSVLIGGAVKITFPETFPVQFSLFPLWAHCAAAGVESSSAIDPTTKGSSKMSVAKSPAAKDIQRRTNTDPERNTGKETVGPAGVLSASSDL